MHGTTEANESKTLSQTGGGQCTSMASSYHEALSNPHLLKLLEVSTTSCSFRQLVYTTQTPYLAPTHVIIRSFPLILPWSIKVFRHGLYQVQSSSFGGKLLYQHLFFPLSLPCETMRFPSYWVKQASPPNCLVLFSMITGPSFIILLLYHYLQHPLISFFLPA